MKNKNKLKLHKHQIGYIIAGVHSNFPVCCIMFFTLKWVKFKEKKSRKYFKKIPNEVEYIPCPKCLKHKKFIKPHMCCHADNTEICGLYWDFEI